LTTQVIHNTGHGGDGIALSWGSAVEATKLVQDIIQNGNSMAKAKL